MNRLLARCLQETERGRLWCGGDAYEAGQATHAGSQIWLRFAAHGHKATAWPEQTAIHEAILALPKGKESLRFCLAALHNLLVDKGYVLVYGYNDEGIKSANKIIGEFFETVEPIYVGDHGRILKASGKVSRARAVLEDLRETQALGAVESWVAYPGLFADGGLDAATALLCANLPPIKTGARVCDYACGTGVVAFVARHTQDDVKLTLLDHDPLALHAAQQNVLNATYVLSDGWNAIPETQKFDVILSNPPFHRGHVQDHSLVTDFIAGALKRLAPEGVVRFVTAQTLPVAQALPQARQVATTKGVIVFEITS